MSRPPVYLRIDEIEIENKEQLEKFADNATHRVETVFYAKFCESYFHYKTHLYIGKIRFLADLMIIDADEEHHGINISIEKPVNTDYHMWYWNYFWRGGISMQLSFKDTE
jgi:hypothetical protein